MFKFFSAIVLVGSIVVGFGRQFFTIHFTVTSPMVLGGIAIAIILFWLDVEFQAKKNTSKWG